MPLVSVIIPAYNAEKFIEATLDSVFSQTFKDFEVIVIDDASSDNTRGILSNYEPKIRCFFQDHKGPGAARNLGLKNANGTFIAFLDADDLWLPTKLERQITFMQQHPEYGIVATEMAWFNETGITEPAAKRSMYSISNGFVLEKLLFQNWIAPSCSVIKKECFDRLGGFDEEFDVWAHEDWMMWLQIAAHYPIFFLDEPLSHVRVHQTSYSRSKPEAQFQALFRALEKIEMRNPELAKRPALLRKAAFTFCLDRGKEDLYSLELEMARQKLRKAIGYEGSSVPARLLYALSFCPLWILRVLKRLVRVLGAQKLVQKFA